MRETTLRRLLLAGVCLFPCCRHADVLTTAPVASHGRERIEQMQPADTFADPDVVSRDPVSLRFDWPEQFVAHVREEVVYRRRVMQTEHRRRARWSYVLRSDPADEGIMLYATDLVRGEGEPLPVSVVELNALQPALVIGTDGALRRIERLAERHALRNSLSSDGLDREVAEELRDAALREDQFVALDAMRWSSLVALWNHVTLRPNEVVLVDGWFAPDASGTLGEALPRGDSGASSGGSAAGALAPRASLQLVGRVSCPDGSSRLCVELRVVNVVEDRRTIPASVFRVDVTLVTEPDSLRPHRLVERASQMSRFDAVGAESSTTVERRLELRYDPSEREANDRADLPNAP